jgi:hypothetical protein
VVVIVVFLVSVFISAVMKAGKAQGGRPQWPGPVAGPNMPGYPRAPLGRAPQPAPSPAANEVEPLAEPVFRESLQSRMEGKDLAESVDDEIARFDASTGHFPPPAVVKGTIEESTERYDPSGGGMVQFGGRLNQNALAQAVLMAEVLGKPKALRSRKWR